MHFQSAGRTPVARLHDRTPGCPATRVVGGMSTPRADWLLGLPLTIFHGMWLVLSNA
jgi:hypothetical protein